MRENYTYKKCVSCTAEKPVAKAGKKAGLLTGLLLVLLPKCPLCIIAYSSTLMLCSKETSIISTQTQNSFVSTGITVLFCLIILLSLFFNYRDDRTKYALALALTGSLLLVASTVWAIGPFMYYTGTVIIFAGIWINGSMLYVLNKLKNFLHKIENAHFLPTIKN
jgi:amino acid transporter